MHHRMHMVPKNSIVEILDYQEAEVSWTGVNKSIKFCVVKA